MKKQNMSLLAITAAALSLLLASGMIVQPAFAHAHTSLNVTGPDVSGKTVTIVLGHTSEPTYGAKPGIHDGKHNLEVTLSDTATKLPLTGAQLKVDKYYFKDFNAFKKAKALKDATEIEKNVTVGSVFGDPGHYVARQLQKDGIYGYRLYGTISYFKVANMSIDSTVFCTSSEGSTSKFNSLGWTGAFGCTEDIDDILFPTKNSDVNKGNGNSKASFDVPAAGNGAAVQQASLTVDGSSATVPSTMNAAVAGTASSQSVVASISLLQLLAMIGIPAAAVAGVVGIRSFRNNRRDSQL